MSEDESVEDEFPVSDVVPRRTPWNGWAWSPMWIVTLLCLLIAAGLTWASLDSPGVWVEIAFDTGHGLKVGDAVMYRGIEVGRVASVTLRRDLRGIDVEVLLNAEADGVAVAGSRFWIVRPQVNVQGITGLETAIGSKYISVLPGESEKRQRKFVGLETPPPDGADRGGIELVLRGEDRWGVSPGSPLSWRGIEVGQVLGCSLSPDAQHVDTRVRLDARYQSLLSNESKFWVTSGIQMDLSMTGLKLSTESLATIARGGVAFITPTSGVPMTSVSDAINAVQPGDVFKLHRKLNPDWIASARGITRFTAQPPSMVRVNAVWRESFLGIARKKSMSAWALPVVEDEKTVLLVPRNIVTAGEQAVAGSLALTYEGNDDETPLIVSGDLPADQALIRIPIDAATLKSPIIPANRFRTAQSPEDAVAIANHASHDAAQSDNSSISEMIGREQITVGDGVWNVRDSQFTSDVWNGAPVVSTKDEKIIGVLLVTDRDTTIAVIR